MLVRLALVPTGEAADLVEEKDGEDTKSPSGRGQQRSLQFDTPRLRIFGQDYHLCLLPMW